MTRSLSASSLALALALAAGASPAWGAVFGKDDRRPVPPRLAAAAAAVGTLHAPGRGSINECNAVCVGPRVIATSAHCLYFPVRNGSRPNLAGVSFRNAKGTSAIAGAARGEAEWNVVAGATYVSKATQWIVSHDWALARLEAPLCEGSSLGLAVKNKWGDLFDDVRTGHVFVISNNRYGTRLREQYAGSCEGPRQPLVLALQWLAIDLGSRDPAYLIPHRCDFKHGASGSPLLIEQDGKVFVLGVNAAESDGRILAKKLGRTLARQVTANFAVSVAAFEPQLDLLREPGAPVPRAEVLGLQKGLKALGRYKAAPDGIYGRLTRQSILDFERRFALTPTGRPSRALLATVEAAAAAPTTARKEIVAIFSNPSRGANDVIAVDPETGEVGRAAPEKGEELDATSERALAACRLSGASGCRLFAVGDEIVFESTPEEVARLIATRQAAAPLAPDAVPPAEPTGQSR